MFPGLTFCKLHHFDIEPTPDRLSLFIAYLACQTGPLGKLISIPTITSYLSGVTHFLEPSYPNI